LRESTAYRIAIDNFGCSASTVPAILYGDFERQPIISIQKYLSRYNTFNFTLMHFISPTEGSLKN